MHYVGCYFCTHSVLCKAVLTIHVQCQDIDATHQCLHAISESLHIHTLVLLAAELLLNSMQLITAVAGTAVNMTASLLRFSYYSAYQHQRRY
jgi:hypothetical protein